MDSDLQIAQEDPAALAFTGLHGEIALLRRAIEHLASERTEITVPDYSETLGMIAKNGEALSEAYQRIAKSPALEVTPETLTRRIASAGEAARREDRIMLVDAKTAHEQAIGQLKDMMRSVRDLQRQDYWVIGGTAAGVLVGILFHVTLNGPVSRALPASWMMPEKIAAEALDMPRWEAGARLMATANPEEWRRLVRAGTIGADNREILDTCQAKAASKGGTVRCTIELKPEK